MDHHEYIHLFPIVTIFIMLPMVISFAFTGGSEDLRKDMYKNMTVEVTKLVFLLYLISPDLDFVDLATKVAGMLTGLLLYYTILYPVIFGQDVKEDVK